MLITIIEVKRQVGSSQEHSWQETDQSLGLHQCELQEDVWLASPAEVSMTVRNGGDRLLFDGTVSARLRLVCGRCLAEFTQDVSYEITEQLLFSRYNTKASSRGDGEEDENSEIEVLEGDTVDVTEMAVDALLSGLPMKPLCREDCLGLCPVCGQDLNQGSCDCDESEVDPRLAALAEWLDKK
ncbi:MAG: DUF177 domain-containing protein [Symbiobacteriaceae bacterium]|nr:DUF177 domain-containing protein [Symbiobacteriaceae bacterium]